MSRKWRPRTWWTRKVEGKYKVEQNTLNVQGIGEYIGKETNRSTKNMHSQRDRGFGKGLATPLRGARQRLAIGIHVCLLDHGHTFTIACHRLQDREWQRTTPSCYSCSLSVCCASLPGYRLLKYCTGTGRLLVVGCRRGGVVWCVVGLVFPLVSNGFPKWVHLFICRGFVNWSAMEWCVSTVVKGDSRKFQLPIRSRGLDPKLTRLQTRVMDSYMM